MNRRPPTITEVFDKGTPIDAALRLGVRDALVRHKLLGQRIGVWEDGRAVVLEPHQIPVDLPVKARDRRSGKASRGSARRRSGHASSR